MGLHSRGTRGFTQSRNAWVYTVSERVGLHSLGRVGLDSRGTPEVTQSMNAWVYTVEERLGLQSRNAWIYSLGTSV